MPGFLKRPFSGGYYNSLVETSAKPSVSTAVFPNVQFYNSTTLFYIPKHRDLQTNSPGTNTNHQSVIKISSFASSIAFATSSKYPLALTYLKRQVFCFIFLTKQTKRHLSYGKREDGSHCLVSTKPPVYFV